TALRAELAAYASLLGAPCGTGAAPELALAPVGVARNVRSARIANAPSEVRRSMSPPRCEISVPRPNRARMLAHRRGQSCVASRPHSGREIFSVAMIDRVTHVVLGHACAERQVARAS